MILLAISISKIGTIFYKNKAPIISIIKTKHIIHQGLNLKTICI
jgi:hypothetical protein